MLYFNCDCCCSCYSTHLKLFVLIFILLDGFEEFSTGNRYNTLVRTIAYHRVTLSGSRLSIRKERRVVSFPGVIQNSSAKVIKHLLLKRGYERSVLIVART